MFLVDMLLSLGTGYLAGSIFCLVLYTAFAIRERNGFDLDFTDFGDIAFAVIFWFFSIYPILTGTRVVEKRKDK